MTAVAPVLTTLDAGVAVITLNRPERGNAWTPTMEESYFDALEVCEADPAVRAMVVTGAGRHFCVGGDMDDLGSVTLNEQQSESQLHREQDFPRTIGKPIIAAIRGGCAGIGLVQALMCDIRFVEEGAKLTTSFARLGLTAEHGISWLLPQLVGVAAAQDLLLSGRVVLAAEAVRMGLVNRRVPSGEVLGEAIAYATELANWSSPSAMKVIKRQIYNDAFSGELKVSMRRADELVRTSVVEADFREGIASFGEKRRPQFRPLGSKDSVLHEETL
jgi:enoyl-CoA hydratase/carnithine racemase